MANFPNEIDLRMFQPASPPKSPIKQIDKASEKISGEPKELEKSLKDPKMAMRCSQNHSGRGASFIRHFWQRFSD